MLACETCRKPFERAELRPYGPNGTLICFECGMKPENKAETQRQFRSRLDLLGPDAILIDAGPVPAAVLDPKVKA